MMLSEKLIQDKNIIINPNEKGWRSSSYDLHIGRIYVDLEGDRIDELPESDKLKYCNPNTDNTLEKYSLPPQGMAVIISDEEVDLPAEVCGLAMPKTTLCKAGLLCLNTGIVDAGYRGWISSTVINFTNKPITLQKGEVFLRLIFHEIKTPQPVERGSGKKIEDYVACVAEKANNYPATFMDLPSHVDRLTKNITRRYMKWGIFLISVLGLAFTLINTIIPVCVLNADKVASDVEERLLQRYIPVMQSDVQRNVEDKILNNDVPSLAKNMKSFELRMDGLQQELRNLAAMLQNGHPKVRRDDPNTSN